MAQKKIRPLTASEVTFEVIVEPEEDPVAGHFATGDDDRDRELEREIIEAFNAGSVEAWCCITVKATWEGITATDHLGCCSHLRYDGSPSLAQQVEDTVSAHGMREEALAALNWEVEIQAQRGLELFHKLKPAPVKRASRASEHVHEARKGVWVVATLDSNGRYTAPLRNPQPGGLHSYQSRDLADLATADVHVYRSRSSALRAARRIFGDD
jgi:hypothetical protein